MNTPRLLIIILGPTASGKSALGVKLARHFQGLVISADSRQVYRDLNIGTAKITPTEMKGVPHYLLSIASPRGQYSVARYVRDVKKVLVKIPDDKPIFLVGGSPFYIKALTESNSFSAAPPDMRLRRRLAGKTAPQLLAILKRLDPQRVHSIDPANRRRLIRAIEIAMSKTQPKHPAPPLFHRILKIGPDLPRLTLYRRIDTRVDKRMKRGLVAEVASLHRRGISWRRLDSFGLEYRFISRYLRGQLSRSEAVANIKSATHDFTRRQLTWWRKENDIHWIKTPAQATKLVASFLSHR